MLKNIRKAVEIYPKATLFELYDRGYHNLFQQLIACLISVRTYDEVSLLSSLRLFETAKTPEEIENLSLEEINNLIFPATFHWQKARNIKMIAQQIKEKFNGQLPAKDELLQSLPGIGPKCSHLALGISQNLPFIGVDIHVHRVTNCWFLSASIFALV